MRYVALLRGINVGGKNVIRMAALRAAFEELGHAEVQTYIQSGNVVFDAPKQARAALAERLEAELTARFETELRVVVLDVAALRRVVEAAPEGFGADTHRCDVIFCRAPLTAARAFAVAELREGIDAAWEGPGVVYYSRLAERASGSRMGRIVATPEYRDMTIRNWRTTTKLLALASA